MIEPEQRCGGNDPDAVAIRTPEIVARLETLGFDPVASTPEQFKQSFEADFKLWSELVRSAGIQPE